MEHHPGSVTYFHKGRKAPKETATGEIDSIELISDHIERHIGPIEMVFHELKSDLVHIDVHMVAPTPERNCYTFVTSGMSDRPMTTPQGQDQLRFAELMISLPAGWPVGESEWKDERAYWPIRLLKILARFPHLYQTWLGYGHTIPNGDPPAAFAENTRLNAALIQPSFTIHPDHFKLEVSPEKTIRFFAVVPIHQNEMLFTLRNGIEALLDRFDKKAVTDIVDPSRPSVVA